MMVRGRDAMLAPLQNALRDAKADEAEIHVHRRRSAITRYAKNEIHQNAVADETHVQARVVIGKAVGIASANSLDDKRQNFHFSTQCARVIRDGALDGYVRGVAFQSLTPDFWGRCDGVADDWELHGFLSCAKGEPLQLMRVGHGAAHARFRDVPIEVRE